MDSCGEDRTWISNRRSSFESRTSASDPTGDTFSELEFIGTDVGEFDLRDVLVFDDGGPIDRMGRR